MSKPILHSHLRTDGTGAIVGLEPAGWRPDVRVQLEELVRDEAMSGNRDGDGKYQKWGRSAVFDFDNTLFCRDLGDAVLDRLAAKGHLDQSTVARAFSPSFGVDGDRRRLEDNPKAYYEALQRDAPDHDYDPEPLAAAYAWAVQVMAGLSPSIAVEVTREVLDGSDGAGRDAAPFPYPEMIELLGFLLSHGFQVFIVSATNVWTTRWAVMNVINPQLKRRFRSDIAVRPECVIGISLLMKDRRSGRLISDARLVRTDAAYRLLEPDALARYELTPLLSFPVSTYAGKVGCLRVLDPDDRPLLAAGDSDNDLPLLAEAKHRLWIARLDDSPLQERVAAEIAHESNWLVQPVLTGRQPGFIASREELSTRQRSASLEASLGFWREAGYLPEF